METVNDGKHKRQARNLKADYVHPTKQKLTGTSGEKSGKRKHVTLKSIWLPNIILVGERLSTCFQGSLGRCFLNSNSH